VSVENVERESAAQAFGRRVRVLRQARLWTQPDLVRHLTAAGHPMHQTTIAKLESGVRPTDVDEITAIAAIFGVAPATLFEDVSPETWLRQALHVYRSRVIQKTEERDRLRARLATLDAELHSALDEYRKLARELGQEVDDIGEH